MKLPAMNELLRIIAAAGITLLVVALAIMFFMWVFSSADREHRRVQPLAVSSSAERSRSISASWRSILRTSSPIIANITMMAVKATENPINILNRCLHSSWPISRAVFRTTAFRGWLSVGSPSLSTSASSLEDSGRHWPRSDGSGDAVGKALKPEDVNDL